MEDLPLSLAAAQTIILGRQAAEEIIKGRDDRLLVIVGPCSIHDTKAALEYGNFLIFLRIRFRWDCSLPSPPQMRCTPHPTDI